MTREEKQKAIDALKISAPIMAVTAEKFNDYVKTLNMIMDWLEQEPCENAPDINDDNLYKCSCGYGWDKSKVFRHHFCPNCGKAIDGSIKSCEDCISREDAIKQCGFGMTSLHIADCLRKLSPVTPQPNNVLDNIRAEIEKKIVKRPWLDYEDRERDRNDAFLEVLDIIDKYKTKSEGTEE